MTEKVGILFLFAQDGFGADAAVHADIIRNLDRDKFDVHVACTGSEALPNAEPLSILREIPNITLRVSRFAPSLGQRDLQAALRLLRGATAFSADFFALLRYIAKHRIRVIHSAERPRDSAYNVILAKLSGARSVVHVHVKWSAEYSPLARWAVQSADAVFSISQYVTGTLLSTGRAGASIYTVLNGIGTTRWDPTVDGQGLRREFDIPLDALVLASVSRLFSWKGQRELLRALAQVLAVRSDVFLMIVGADAPEVEGTSFSQELKVLAKELGVSEHVRFTGPRSDVPQVMAACDIFSLASFEEPFGLVYLEAMAMQRPVIAIDSGGVPEVVENGVTGLLSPQRDVDALAANILKLLADPELRRKMGESGRARVLAQFTAQRMGRDAGRAYEQLLASPG